MYSKISIAIMSMGLCLTGSASTEEVSVEIGPVSSVGGTAVRIRSEHVGGTAFMLLAFTSEAVPSPFAGAPGLGVPLSSSLFTFALDASGDRDIPVVVPVTASLGSLQARIQVVALAASGVLSKSNVAVTSLAPSPPGAFLQAGQEALPGAAFGSGAFSVRSGDFDLDGRPELLVQSSLGTEYWDNSSGAGGMSLVAKPDVFSGLPEVGGAYEIGDVNRDGFLDIVSYSPEPTAQAIERVLATKDRALIIPVLVAVDEDFQLGMIQVAADRKYEGGEVSYIPDSILPEPYVEAWVERVALEMVAK